MSPEPQPYFPLIAPLFPLHRRHLGRHSPPPGATQKRRRPSQLLPTSRLFSTPSVARSVGSLCTWLLFAVRVEALCTPSNKSELKFMVNVCLRRSPDGNCTNFAAMPDGADCGSGGGMNGMIQDWDVTGVVDMESMFNENNISTATCRNGMSALSPT